jgi:uncharacterized protein
MLTLALLLVACPNPKTRTTPEAREQWCEDAAGLRDGPRRAWYASGKPWFEGEYRAGKRTGVWKFWYDGGGPMSVASYADDKAHGTFTRFHENGQKSSEGVCKAGVADGKWTRFWPNGKPEIEVELRDGKIVGAPRYGSRRGAAVAEPERKIVLSELGRDCAD